MVHVHQIVMNLINLLYIDNGLVLIIKMVMI